MPITRRRTHTSRPPDSIAGPPSPQRAQKTLTTDVVKGSGPPPLIRLVARCSLWLVAGCTHRLRPDRMTDVAASLEAVRLPLTDIAMRSLDLEKYLWVDEFTEVALTTSRASCLADARIHAQQVAKDVVAYTQHTEQKLVRHGPRRVAFWLTSLPRNASGPRCGAGACPRSR